MEKIENIDWGKFKVLVKKIIEYKSKFSYVPIRAESWEEVLYVVFAHMFMKNKVFWDPVSHAKGIDLVVKLNGDTLTVSAKGGQIKDNFLSFSSYRLTRYKTIEDKLSFLEENADKLDVYLICSREEKGSSIEYKIFKIYSKKLIPPLFLARNNWSKDKQGWVFKKYKKAGFKARIVKSMSHQLWYSIPITSKKLEQLCDISLPKESLGKLLHEVLNSTD